MAAAIESDPTAIEPLVELGQYLYAVEDDAKAAVKQFAIAEQLAEKAWIESLIGRLKCLKELGRDHDVWQCFTRLSLLLANSPYKDDLTEQIEDELSEFLEERHAGSQPA